MAASPSGAAAASPTTTTKVKLHNLHFFLIAQTPFREIFLNSNNKSAAKLNPAQNDRKIFYEKILDRLLPPSTKTDPTRFDELVNVSQRKAQAKFDISGLGGSSSATKNNNKNAGDRRQREEENNNDDDDDDELMVDFEEFSLVCVLSKLPIRIPSRLKQCTHLSCCDLPSWIASSMAHRSARLQTMKLTCPFCNKAGTMTDVEIDFFQLRHIYDYMIAANKTDEAKAKKDPNFTPRGLAPGQKWTKPKDYREMVDRLDTSVRGNFPLRLRLHKNGNVEGIFAANLNENNENNGEIDVDIMMATQQPGGGSGPVETVDAQGRRFYNGVQIMPLVKPEPEYPMRREYEDLEDEDGDDDQNNHNNGDDEPVRLSQRDQIDEQLYLSVQKQQRNNDKNQNDDHQEEDLTQVEQQENNNNINLATGGTSLFQQNFANVNDTNQNNNNAVDVDDQSDDDDDDDNDSIEMILPLPNIKGRPFCHKCNSIVYTKVIKKSRSNSNYSSSQSSSNSNQNNNNDANDNDTAILKNLERQLLSTATSNLPYDLRQNDVFVCKNCNSKAKLMDWPFVWPLDANTRNNTVLVEHHPRQEETIIMFKNPCLASTLSALLVGWLEFTHHPSIPRNFISSLCDQDRENPQLVEGLLRTEATDPGLFVRTSIFKSKADLDYLEACIREGREVAPRPAWMNAREEACYRECREDWKRVVNGGGGLPAVKTEQGVVKVERVLSQPQPQQQQQQSRWLTQYGNNNNNYQQNRFKQHQNYNNNQ